MKVKIILSLALSLAASGSASDLLSSDPPTKLGRVSYTSGEVSFVKASDPGVGLSAASINRIVTDGDGLFAGPGARTEVDFGTSFLRLDSDTFASVTIPEQSSIRIEFSRGSINLRVQKLQETDTLQVDLPFGKISLRMMQAGYYRLQASPASGALVAVRDGRIEIAGLGSPVYLEPHQQLRLTAATLDHFVGPESADDDFDQFCKSRDEKLLGTSAETMSPPADAGTRFTPPPGLAAPSSSVPSDNADAGMHVSPSGDEVAPSAVERSSLAGGPQLSPKVVGGTEVNQINGDWHDDRTLGPIWTPRNVDETWAPFRYGEWNWVQPWGWTWVDDAPWGFATSHYGRWIHSHNRWAWVPGPVLNSRPAYAPALVAFVGSGPGRPELLAGGSVPAVAWFPLGPGDAYIPPYEASVRYWQAINQANTTLPRGTNIEAAYATTRGGTYMGEDFKQAYANRKVPYGTTAVTLDTFVSGKPLGRSRVAVTPKELNSAKVVGMTATVAPTMRSVMPVSQGKSLAKPPEEWLTTQRSMLQRTGFQTVPFSAQQQELSVRPGRPLNQASMRALSARVNRVNVDHALPVQAVNATAANDRRLNVATPAPTPATKVGATPENNMQRKPDGRTGSWPSNNVRAYPAAPPSYPTVRSRSLPKTNVERPSAQPTQTRPAPVRRTAPRPATPVPARAPAPPPASKSK